MGQKKSEDKSFVACKKEDLYDQLFTALEGPEELRIGDMSLERRKELGKILDYIYGKPGAKKPEGWDSWEEMLKKAKAKEGAEKLQNKEISPERRERLRKILDQVYRRPGESTPEDREYWDGILKKA